MTGPRPAGRPWTAAEEAQLRELIISRVKVGLIAKKLNRSPGAVYARINSLKKPPRDLAFGRQPRSLPSERLASRKLRTASQSADGLSSSGGVNRTRCSSAFAPAALQLLPSTSASGTNRTEGDVPLLRNKRQ